MPREPVEWLGMQFSIDGAVVAGDPSRIDTVTDIWTFARDTSQRDPNWKLIATDSGQ